MMQPCKRLTRTSEGRRTVKDEVNHEHNYDGRRYAVRRSVTRTGAPDSRSCSATVGPSARIAGRARWSSWPLRAIAALPMTVVATAGRASPGTVTRWTPMPTISRRSLDAHRNARPEGCGPNRLLRGRRRSRPVYRPPRHETGGQGRADFRRPAADAENGGHWWRLRATSSTRS